MQNWQRYGKSGWRHRLRPALRVFIRRNANSKRPEKYQVFHNHPTKEGGVVAQPFDYAKTMKQAQQKATVHLRHWHDPEKWARYW